MNPQTITLNKSGVTAGQAGSGTRFLIERLFQRALLLVPAVFVFSLLVCLASPVGSFAADKQAKTTDKKATSKSSKIVNATFDDIKLKMKKTDPFTKSLLTKKVKELDGRNIRIRGYVLPSFKQKGIKQFVLVRDNMQCCFGPGAELFDSIIVEMIPGRTISFTVRPIAVEGKFTIKEFKGPDGKHLSIYHLTGFRVK